MNVKHSPTPWRIYNTTARDEAIEVGSVNLNELGDLAAEAYSMADGVHIVRCVNAHDELVAALEAILDHPRTDDSSIVFMPSEVKAARAALAKAKGEA